MASGWFELYQCASAVILSRSALIYLGFIAIKYACKSCDGVESEGPTVKIAPVPVQLLPKSIATEGLIAHLIVPKNTPTPFTHHFPVRVTLFDPFGWTFGGFFNLSQTTD
jgi:hypothetical protein